jgi:hypothetical protein
MSINGEDSTTAALNGELVMDNVVFNCPIAADPADLGAQALLASGGIRSLDPVIDNMAEKPLLREITLRLPRSAWPIPKAYGHVFAFTEDGRVVVDWQDPSGAYPDTTAVTEAGDRVYVQSLHARTLGWMERPVELP